MNINKLSASQDIRTAPDSKANCMRILKDATPQDRAKAIKEAIQLLESYKNKKATLTIVVAETT
jgi:hypothetical protein